MGQFVLLFFFFFGSSGFFVGGYGLRPLGWEFRMCFGHGRRCVCPLDHVHHLPNGGRQNALRAKGPGICLAQPTAPGYRSTQTHKRANGPAVGAGSSIPNVSFVNLDAVLFAEPPVLVLEGTRREMIPFGETLVAGSSRRRCAASKFRAKSVEILQASKVDGIKPAPSVNVDTSCAENSRDQRYVLPNESPTS